MIQVDFKNFKENHPYLAKCFNKKTLIIKGTILLCALVIVLSLSLSFYFWLCKRTPDKPFGPTNGFWYLYVTWNDGIGWSALAGNTSAIYAIQSIVFIILTGVFFFVANGKICASFVALAMFGGLFNLIQRASTPIDLIPSKIPSVLDYFKFGFWPTFPTFNWPDTFVVIGVFGFVISYIVYVIIEAKKSYYSDDSKPSETQASQTPMQDQYGKY